MINWIHALIRYETRARIDGQEPSIVEVTAHREPPLALVDREDEQRLVSVARDTLSRYHAPPDVNDGLSDCLDVIALHGNGAMSYIDVMAHAIFENDRTGDNLHRSLRIDSLHSLGTSRSVAGC